MAYDEDKLFEKCIDVIRTYDLVYVQDVIAYLPCSSQVFYAHFPTASERHTQIIEELSNNKTTLKIAIRNKLLKSNKAAELIALYKLLSNDEERKALSMKYTDTKVTITSELDAMTDEQLNEEYRKMLAQQHNASVSEKDLE